MLSRPMRTRSNGSAAGSVKPAGGDGKRDVLRERARRDVDEGVEHHLAEAGPAVALALIDALEDALCQIGEQPALGSPRYAHELELPGLRFRTVSKSPYLIFYVDRETEIDV